MATMERTGAQPRFRNFAGLVPLFTGLLLVLIANTPISLLVGLVPAPLLALVPVYFWCLVRPDLMTPIAVMAIGLAEDILSGGPPGVWTLAFVLTYALVARQRDSFAGLSGVAAVVGFAGAALFACATAYLTVAALALLSPNGHVPPLLPIVSELAMTVLFYIPTVLVVGWVHRRLVGASRGDI
jgi:rod shape-determining protein MreD